MATSRESIGVTGEVMGGAVVGSPAEQANPVVH